MRIIVNGKIENATIVEQINTDNYIQSQSNIQGISDSNDNLLLDILNKAIRMSERKYTKKLEDIHNDDFTDWLRDKGYYVTDQTRSGKALKTAGEIDIMIREKDGTPYSIIEAFRLQSCGEKNTVVVSHINKLLNDYDTVGHLNNYIIVYSEASNFLQNWDNYKCYVESLNNNKIFTTNSRLISFEDMSDKYSTKTDIKVGMSKHYREGKNVNVYHVFINMSVN